MADTVSSLVKSSGGGNDKTRKFLIDFISGGTAATISKTAIAPIERVKLLLQIQAASKDIPKDKQYSGIFNTISCVSKEQGVASLWRGNMANVIRYFPTQALNFAFRNTYKQIFIKSVYDKEKDFWRFFAMNLLSGGLAGGTTALFVYPLDYARTRLALDIGKGATREFRGLGDVLKKTFRSDGIFGWYCGLNAYLFGIVIYRAGYFGLFDTAKLVVGKEMSFFEAWAVAQSTTMFMSLLLYPTDTIRRRMMLQSGRKEKMYTGYMDCLKKTWREEGIQGGYKGFGANLLRSLSGALLLAMYEEIQKIINQRQKLKSSKEAAFNYLH